MRDGDNGTAAFLLENPERFDHLSEMLKILPDGRLIQKEDAGG